MATIALGEYLFTRLRQLGVGSVFGVPGDFNLELLDYVEITDLHWVGNANELNAGYAADGYARTKGLSVVVTTFGVGELSALTAIAGGYAERSPVVHIVGTPSTALQDSKALIHHSLGDGNLRIFSEVYTKFTVAQVNLRDSSTGPELLDRALQRCLTESRPIYIEVPTDMVKVHVQASCLDNPLLESPRGRDLTDIELEAIVNRLQSAERPLLLVDGFARQYRIAAQVDELARTSHIPTVTTPSGKDIVNETYPNYLGVYTGWAGNQNFKSWYEARDVVLHFGPLHSNINTIGFTTIPPASRTISFHQDSIDICGSMRINDVCVRSALQSIIEMPRVKGIAPGPASECPQFDDISHNAPKAGGVRIQAVPEVVIHQDTFYPAISQIFRPHDIILADTGTASVGARNFNLPPHARLMTSSLWLSIGHMLPAAQGAALALRELVSSHRVDGHQHATAKAAARVILFQGDGAMQMTVQAISDIIRNRLDMIIFVLNNNGYTIERLIHGRRAKYNDVQPWRYLEALSFFGAPTGGGEFDTGGHGTGSQYRSRTISVKTRADLMALIHDPGLRELGGLTIVEVILDRDDATESLRILTGNS